MQTKLLIICMMAFLSVPAGAQLLKQASFREQVEYIDTTYSDLPSEELEKISDYLDSSTLPEHCFKYLSSSDKSKCLAFYIVPNEDPSCHNIINEFPGFTLANANKGMSFLGYTVYGILYENKWYYTYGEAAEITGSNKTEAKNNFLVQTLNRKDFFGWKGEKENKKFWLKNEFECDHAKKTTGAVIPSLVEKAMKDKEIRVQKILDNKIRCIANRYYNSLWKELQEMDPLTYHKPFQLQMGDCFRLFNPERSMILLPLIYFDKMEKPWISYFLLQCTPSDTLLFHWDRVGTNPIDWPRGNEDRAIVYDMRKFTGDTNWEKTHMISDKNFWKQYFTENDLLLIRTSVSKTAVR